MAKLNLLLLAALVACALGLVTSQHKARKTFSDLEREQERARNLDVEYGQLQLEASTWGLHSRVEKIAGSALGMQPPDPRRTRLVNTLAKEHHPLPQERQSLPQERQSLPQERQ